MRVHREELSDVSRYIEGRRRLRLEDKEPHFRNYLRALEPFKKIDASTRILEVGTGMGWFPLLCQRHGLTCKGLEISPRLVEYARQWGRQYGLEPDIELGNLENTDLGRERYDVIIASSLFEHIEHWRPALQRLYDALRPGGALFFESPNKFSLISPEFRLPFYSWLPDRARYWLRRQLQGGDIMKLGIDFNQFTHSQLRREFRRLGFAAAYDRVEILDPAHVRKPWRRWVARAAKRHRTVRALSLAFVGMVRFVCIK